MSLRKSFLFRFCFAAVFSFFSLNAIGQKVIYNFDIHPEWPGFEEVVTTWTKFLESPSDSAGAEFWNPMEVEKYGRKNYFLINSEFNPPLLKMAKIYRAQILSITEKDSFYKITTQFYYPKHDTLMTLCIVEVYARKLNGKYKLYNALPINLRRNWETAQVGYIKYHYPRYHEFDRAKALRQNAFVTDSLPLIFDIKTDTVDYYFAETRQELNTLRGFVFNVGGSGTEKPSGKTASGNVVYSVGTGEYYPHELVHVFVDPVLPPKHQWATEGLATFLGGSRGKSLDWHIIRTSEYLDNHPEIDLNNMLNLLTMDEYTDYRYVLGGAVIQLIYENEAWAGVKEFLLEAKDEETYYAALEKHLGWKRNEIDQKFRKELKEMAVRNSGS